MKKLAWAVCVTVMMLASVQRDVAGQGQRRVGPRSKPTPPVPPSATAPSDSTESPSQVTEQAGAHKPAIEYQYLMELRFYENKGGFLIEGLELVFPPRGLRNATFVISRSNGDVVTRVPLRLETPLASYTAFGMLLANAVSGLAPIGEPGDYVLSVNIDGQAITTMPFTMKREASSDPYNPKNTFVREGPWRDLAHFSVVTDEPDSHIEFSW